MAHTAHPDAPRLFDELVGLDPVARAERLAALALPAALAHEIASLLAAAERAGDFLGVLRDGRPAPTHPAPGEVVAGRYRIERHLGSGAMGDVHLAWDEELDRPVALKFLRAIGDADADASARSRAEARAAARLDHPHVGTVYDVGETAERRRFIAMAYYPGDTLRQRIASGPLRPRDALRIAAQIAGALAAAHAAGIVHRDVKPANVLFDAAGAARLTDFGIARLLTATDAAGDALPLGTPAYMSPEQRRGEPADPSADLWALGVLLHEMLTGVRPSEPFPDPAAGVRDGAGVAHALLLELLTTDRARRPTSADGVRRALVELTTTLDATTNARGAVASRGTVPNAVSSLVGREPELAELRRLLAGTRLCTLTGPGGTGKTRLALELAARVRDDYADGVWFVPLAEISDAALVPSSIAQALGVRDLGGAPLRDVTIAALGTRRLLLVLDNFEHVLGAASYVATLLAACPAVTILVTSRAPLDVQGEQTFPIPPLETPSHDAANVGASDAVQLFVNRARAVRPSFAPDDETLAAIAEICRRLDGLPLAVELAAARTKLLSPRAILSRMARRLDELRADMPDRPSRHGTLRAVIDWSYVLLTDAERALFCRLAVFAGGFTLDAAEVVAPEPATSEPDAPRVLDLLASLCDKSLLHAVEQRDGEPRFHMLETVREFGLDRLTAGADEAAARHAHRAYCVALAERGAEQLRGPDQAAWFDRLEREYANFRAAFDDALDDLPDGVTQAARLAVALHRLWLTRGPLFEGIEQLQRIQAAVDAPNAPAIETSLHARLVSSAAHLAGKRSLFPEAGALFARSLALHRAAGDRHGVAVTLNNLAWQVWNVGDLAAGEAMSLEAMAIHEALGDELGVTLSHNNLAWIALERGDFASAERDFEAVIASHRARGDVRATSFALSWLGVLEERRGALTRAVALHAQALELGDPVADLGYRVLVLVRLSAAKHALDDPDDQIAVMQSEYVPALREFGRLWPLGYGLAELGVMLLDRGDAGAARAAFEEALEARRATGGAKDVAETLLWLGVTHHRTGDDPRAAASLDQALAAAIGYGAPPLLIACVEGIASVGLDLGRTRDAAVLAAAMARARDALGMRRSPRRQREHVTLRRALAATLGATRLAEAWATGTAMTLDDAVACAQSVVRDLRPA